MNRPALTARDAARILDGWDTYSTADCRRILEGVLRVVVTPGGWRPTVTVVAAWEYANA